jgi:hypothetical protein
MWCKWFGKHWWSKCFSSILPISVFYHPQGTGSIIFCFIAYFWRDKHTLLDYPFNRIQTNSYQMWYSVFLQILGINELFVFGLNEYLKPVFVIAYHIPMKEAFVSLSKSSQNELNLMKIIIVSFIEMFTNHMRPANHVFETPVSRPTF